MPAKIVVPNIDIETLADRKDFKIEFGPLEVKETHKQMRVYWVDNTEKKWPIHLLLKDMKVRFPFSRDNRPQSRVKYNMGVELDDQREAQKKGFEHLENLIVQKVFENKHLIFEDHDEIIDLRDVRKCMFPLVNYKKKKGTKKHAGKVFDPTLTLHARMFTDPETKVAEPKLTVVDLERTHHDPSELTYGSVIDVIARVSNLWIATKCNCNLQILKVGCKQFGRVQETEGDFEWEANVPSSTVTPSPFGFADDPVEDFEGNAAMVPSIPPVVPTPTPKVQTDIPIPMDKTSSPKTSPKRKAVTDPNPRPRKRARTSS